MAHFCFRRHTECEFATRTGQCLDRIEDDYGLCKADGDKMPPKGLPKDERRIIAKVQRHRECAFN